AESPSIAVHRTAVIATSSDATAFPSCFRMRKATPIAVGACPAAARCQCVSPIIAVRVRIFRAIATSTLLKEWAGRDRHQLNGWRRGDPDESCVSRWAVAAGSSTRGRPACVLEGFDGVRRPSIGLISVCDKSYKIGPGNRSAHEPRRRSLGTGYEGKCRKPRLFNFSVSQIGVTSRLESVQGFVCCLLERERLLHASPVLGPFADSNCKDVD